jgi:hypothetical protein
MKIWNTNMNKIMDMAEGKPMVYKRKFENKEPKCEF